ncbi:MAG: non-canonical purine NTP diphosphatase [Prevotella sp.]|jgi:XTP/dITP diphosphohydrolase
MRKIVFATNNANKLREIREILGEQFQVLSLSDIGCHEDIPEDFDTLEMNSHVKAAYIAEKYGMDCFADDTGLEVDALGGEPGVHSARYAEGTDHDSQANMRKLLARLDDTTNRRARFRTVITLATVGHEQPVRIDRYVQFVGVVEGDIAKQPRGTEGFGYDPVFVPQGYAESFAQLGEDVKNRISHRARAVQKLAAWLKES